MTKAPEDVQTPPLSELFPGLSEDKLTDIDEVELRVPEASISELASLALHIQDTMAKAGYGVEQRWTGRDEKVCKVEIRNAPGAVSRDLAVNFSRADIRWIFRRSSQGEIVGVPTLIFSMTRTTPTHVLDMTFNAFGRIGVIVTDSESTNAIVDPAKVTRQIRQFRLTIDEYFGVGPGVAAEES